MKYLTLLLLFIFFEAYSQKQANVWYFGNDGAGLDFNNECNPIVLTNGNMNGFEGCAAISDKNTGEFLFSTNSYKVWNRNQDTMPNSLLIPSGSTITQVMIIQQPSSNSRYYIITSEIQAALSGFSPHGYKFHMVDMTMNGGLGGILFKDSLLCPPPVTEKITAIPHANGTDIWLIGHKYNSDEFVSYLVSSSGINTTPIVSQIGKFNGDISSVDAIGELKASPDGTKIAAVTLSQPNIELFDFDNTTGQLSNLITLPENGAYSPPAGGVSGLYGVGFSSNNSMLYVTAWVNNFLGVEGKIIQYNISSNDSATINNSRVNIFTSTQSSFYSLRLAPNNKIYVGHHYSNPNGGYLGVIHNPDSVGLNCNYVDLGLYLNGKACGWGLNSVMDYGYYCSHAVVADKLQVKSLLRVYPNPFTSQINLIFSEEQKNATIIISNSLGQAVKTLQCSGKKLLLETSDINNGVYFIQMMNDKNELSHHKIIKG
ncbi:MAG TPA: T9SS type A sorting domain-containing protein [Bacteroidia bacterium]|nr:T9SS type A sorting domain-containing protein [Bacteroidia bacterium]